MRKIWWSCSSFGLSVVAAFSVVVVVQFVMVHSGSLELQSKVEHQHELP